MAYISKTYLDTLYQPSSSILTTLAGITYSANIQSLLASADYSAARINLGLAIGTNIQAYDADLTTWAGLSPSANAQSLVTAANYAAMRALLDLEVGTDFYSTGAVDTALALKANLVSPALVTPVLGVAAATSINKVTITAPASSAVLTIADGVTLTVSANTSLSGTPLANPMTTLGDSIYGGALGVATRLAGDTSNTRKFLRTQSVTGVSAAPGWDTLQTGDIPDLSAVYQPLDSDLTAIAGLTATTDNFIVSVASAWASRTPAQVRTTLGLVIGTNVQAYDADLTTWAGVTPGTGVATALAINVGSAGALITFNGALGTPSSGTLTNCTFPTLNQNTTGSAASLSISGQSGLITFVGLVSTNRAKTIRDAADTILELGGSYTPTGIWTSLTMVTPVLGTPTSGNLANCTFPTFNQNTTGTAAALTTARTIGGVSFDGTANIVPQTIQSVNEATDTTCFPLFISASGSQSLQPLNNTGFIYNSNTNALTATTFIGALTGTASGNLVSGGALGTPSSGALTNCTFPTLNQNTTGSAASLTTARSIGGTSFNGTADITVATATGGFTITGGELVLAAGTATTSPLHFTSGVVETASEAGDFEYDGVCFYASAIAATRQVNDCEQFTTLTSAYTLANQTAAQKLFNSSTNGAVTIGGSTTYFFECAFSLTALSASSHSVGFAFGGTATLTRQAWWSLATQTAFATASTGQMTYNTAANTTLVTASTTATCYVKVWGKLVVGTGGTLIPQVSQLTNAAAAIVGVDSYFRIWPVGSNSVQTVGNWS